MTLPLITEAAIFDPLFRAEQCTGQPIPGYNLNICTLCDLLGVAQRGINLAVALAIPLAVLFIIYGGFLIMTHAGNASRLESGWKAIRAAGIGIAVVLGSWIIINEVLFLFAQGYPELKLWNKIQCEREAVIQPPAVIAPENQLVVMRGGPLDEGLRWLDGYKVDTPEARALLEKNTDGWDKNPKNNVCTLAKLKPYEATIKAASQKYGVDVSRIQAIIMAESSGNPNPPLPNVKLDKISSYGLMQIRTDTAARLDSSLVGLTNAQVAEKLKDPPYNIQLGTKYYADLLQKYNGNRDLASAAYNGGPGANLPSRDCAGVKRWQCPWDDAAHTIPNKGYEETRKYIPNISAFESKISQGKCA